MPTAHSSGGSTLLFKADTHDTSRQNTDKPDKSWHKQSSTHTASTPTPCFTVETHLHTHGLGNLDSHVSKTTQSNDADLHARLVQAVVHKGAVGGDASSQQRSCALHLQVLWNVQRKPAHKGSESQIHGGSQIVCASRIWQAYTQHASRWMRLCLFDDSNR